MGLLTSEAIDRHANHPFGRDFPIQFLAALFLSGRRAAYLAFTEWVMLSECPRLPFLWAQSSHLKNFSAFFSDIIETAPVWSILKPMATLAASR